tara:strand:+ start:577 stop:1122 length:546 start_codon:yes stop_codon:yes gene_type:complete
MNNNNYKTIIEEKTNEYYKNNGKNRIFKNKQKQELAKEISNEININDYLETIIYIDNNNPSCIFATYEKVKPIIHFDNYNTIINHLDNLIHKILNENDKFYIHVDIFSLTVSGIQRIRPFIEAFALQTFKHSKYQTRVDALEKAFIYNSPKYITNIKSLIEPLVSNLGILEKIVYVPQSKN